MTLSSIAGNSGFNVCVLCVVHLSGFINNLERDSLMYKTPCNGNLNGQTFQVLSEMVVGSSQYTPAA